MKKIVTLAIIILSLSVFAQDFAPEPEPGHTWRDIPLKGDITIPVIFATFADYPAEQDLFITAEQAADDGKYRPVMFSMPDGRSVHDYILDQPDQKLSYYDYIEQAIPAYFNSMTNSSLRISIELIKNPERADGLWVISNSSDYTFNSGMAEDIRAKVDDYFFNLTGKPNHLVSHYTDIAYFLNARSEAE